MILRWMAVLVVALLAGTAADAVAQGRDMGGIGLTVYADPNFRGANATFRTDVVNLQSVGMNDRISSLQVASGEFWEVCEHDSFRGRCQIFSGSEPNLRQRDWNDIISSVRRVRGPGGSGGPGGLGGPRDSRDSRAPRDQGSSRAYPPVQPTYPSPGPGYIPEGLALYTGVNYSGTQQVFTEAVPDLRRGNFDNRAESLRLPPGEVWEVCRDRNFRNCQEVNTDWPSLNGLRMLGEISSLRPRRDLEGGGGWQGQGQQRGQQQGQQPQLYPQGQNVGRAVLYDGRNFTGQSFMASGVHGNLGPFGGRAESLQVQGGVWELCDGANFSGRCITLNEDAYDLSQFGFRNRVRSIRPLPGGVY